MIALKFFFFFFIKILKNYIISKFHKIGIKQSTKPIKINYYYFQNMSFFASTTKQIISTKKSAIVVSGAECITPLRPIFTENIQ